MTPAHLPGIRNIAISGRIASGASTLAKHLSEKINWELLDGGKFFREVSDVQKSNSRPDQIDLDYEASVKRRLSEEEHHIIQSHLAGFDAQGIPGVFKILVICEDHRGSDKLDIRIDRLINRDKISVEQAKEEVKKREEEHLTKFRRLYADNDPNWVYWDPKYYDLVVNTYSLNVEDSLNLVLEKIGYKG